MRNKFISKVYIKKLNLITNKLRLFSVKNVPKIILE